jgi:hypothetical protein
MSELIDGVSDHKDDDHESIRHEYDPATGEVNLYAEVPISEEDYLESFGISPEVTRGRQQQSERVRHREVSNQLAEVRKLLETERKERETERQERKEQSEAQDKKIDELKALIERSTKQKPAEPAKPAAEADKNTPKPSPAEKAEEDRLAQAANSPFAIYDRLRVDDAPEPLQVRSKPWKDSDGNWRLTLIDKNGAGKHYKIEDLRTWNVTPTSTTIPLAEKQNPSPNETTVNPPTAAKSPRKVEVSEPLVSKIRRRFTGDPAPPQYYQDYQGRYFYYRDEEEIIVPNSVVEKDSSGGVLALGAIGLAALLGISGYILHEVEENENSLNHIEKILANNDTNTNHHSHNRQPAHTGTITAGGKTFTVNLNGRHEDIYDGANSRGERLTAVELPAELSLINMGDHDEIVDTTSHETVIGPDDLTKGLFDQEGDLSHKAIQKLDSLGYVLKRVPYTYQSSAGRHKTDVYSKASR